MMNGFERIKAALEGRRPDKVPVMLNNFMMAAHEAGITMEQYRNDPQKIAHAFIKSVEKYNYDGIIVEIDTATLAGAAGVKVLFPSDGPALSSHGILGSLEDVLNMKPVKVENYRYVQVWLEASRLLKEYFGDDIYLRGNCDQAPFSLASMIRGAQEWMTDLLIEEEDMLFRLLEHCEDITGQFIGLMAQTGCHMVSNGDSPAGPGMISPAMYEKFAMPCEKKMAGLAHSAGLPYALHICGNTDSILDRMLLTGADAFELDYKTDISKVYDLYHGSATLIGNIDPGGVLAMGTTTAVRARTTELLETYSGSSRFILNAGCAIPPGTPSENLRTMIETARSFGTGHASHGQQ
jgi:MtaA/CmuA family methyltransferase